MHSILNSRWTRLFVLAIAAVVIGLVVGVGVQMYAPQTLAPVHASYITKYAIEEHDDLRDGDGISHYIRVRYNYFALPEGNVVTQVKVGGRHPDSGFCWYDGKWRREYTKYWERNSPSGSWILVTSNGPTPWAGTGTPGLSYHYLNDNVNLYRYGRVSQELKYKETTWCSFEGPLTFTYPSTVLYPGLN